MPLASSASTSGRPGLDPRRGGPPATGAALDMAEWAEKVGFDMVVLSEHHGVRRRLPARRRS